MAAFFCERCDEPISGGVSQTTCIGCLLGVDPEFCTVCGDPMSADGDEGICGECKEVIDKACEGLDSDDE